MPHAVVANLRPGTTYRDVTLTDDGPVIDKRSRVVQRIDVCPSARLNGGQVHINGTMCYDVEAPVFIGRS